MHEIASLVTCNFKILGGAYPWIPWVPEVFLALFYEDELCEETSGEAARKKPPFARVTAETAHEQPLAPRVTSGPLKAGFHLRRSRSRSRSRSHKRAYDLVKIEYRSRKQYHKLDGIEVGRIRTFPFLPIPFTTPSLMIQ